MSRPQVVIAGAGPGGLAAAMLLAHAGADVVVLERKDRVGGRSATLHAGGFRFDLGPSRLLAQDLGLALPGGAVQPECPPVQLAKAS